MSGPVENLCLSCGLCCDGALFRQIALQEQEQPLAGGEPVLMQPCRFFDGTCTIYAERPAKCRTFQCLVLRQVRNGALSRTDADKLIRDARALIGRLDAALPQAGMAMAVRVQRFLKDKGSADRRATAQVQLDVMAYKKLLSRFLGERTQG